MTKGDHCHPSDQGVDFDASWDSANTIAVKVLIWYIMKNVRHYGAKPVVPCRGSEQRSKRGEEGMQEEGHACFKNGDLAEP
jgi:hypothetical protein